MTVIKNIQHSAQHPEQLIKEYAGINNKWPSASKVVVKREALVQNPANIAKKDNDLASSSSETHALDASGENSTAVDNYLKDVFVSLLPSTKDRTDLLDYLVSVVKYVDYAARTPNKATEEGITESGSTGELDRIKENAPKLDSTKTISKRDVSAVTNNDDSITAKPEPTLGLKIESFIEEVELPPKKLETLPLDVIKHVVYNEMNSNDLKMSHGVFEQTTVIPITGKTTNIKEDSNVKSTEMPKYSSIEDLMYEITDLPPVLENTPLENPIFSEKPSTTLRPKVLFQQPTSTAHKYPEDLTSSYFVEKIPVDDEAQQNMKNQNKIAKSSKDGQYSKNLLPNSDLSEILKQNKRKITGHYAFDIIEEPFPNNLKIHQRIREEENANYQKAVDFNRRAIFQEVVPVQLSMKEPEIQPQENDRNEFLQMEENMIKKPVYVEEPKLEKLRQIEQLKQEKSQQYKKASTKKPIRKEVVIVFPNSEINKSPKSEAIVRERQERPIYLSERPRPIYRSGRTVVRYPVDRPYREYPLPRPVYPNDAPREILVPAPYQPNTPRIIQHPPPVDSIYPPVNSRPLNFPYYSRIPTQPSGIPTPTYYPTQTPVAVPQIPQRPVTISLIPQSPVAIPQRPQTPLAIPQTPVSIPQYAQQYPLIPRYIPNYQLVSHIGNLQQVWINLISPYCSGYRYAPPVPSNDCSNALPPPRDIIERREIVEPDGAIIEEVYERDEE